MLKQVFVNANGQRLQPYAFDRRGGQVNERVHVHNFTTGYDEAWSTRLFLAEHTAERKPVTEAVVRLFGGDR